MKQNTVFEKMRINDRMYYELTNKKLQHHELFTTGSSSTDVVPQELEQVPQIEPPPPPQPSQSSPIILPYAPASSSSSSSSSSSLALVSSSILNDVSQEQLEQIIEQSQLNLAEMRRKLQERKDGH